MVRLLKVVAFFLLLLLLGSTTSIGQTVLNQGTTNTIYRQLGGSANDKWFKLPNDTTIYTSAYLGKSGAIAFKYPYIYYYDSVQVKWVAVGSGTGNIDSTAVNELIADSLAEMDLQRVTDNGNITTKKVVASGAVFGTELENDPIILGTQLYSPLNVVADTISPQKNGIRAATLRLILGLSDTSTTTEVQGLNVMAMFSNYTRTNWGANQSHPAWCGARIQANAFGTLSGIAPFTTALHLGLAGWAGLTFERAGGLVIGFNHASPINYGFGLQVTDVDAFTNGAGIHLLNGDGIYPYNGRWSILERLGYPSYFLGEMRFGDTTDKGPYQLQVTGAEITTGLDKYESDISGTFDARSKIDKGYADATYQSSLGFTPENVANKATSFGVLNNTLYPTTQAVSSYILGLGYFTLPALTSGSVLFSDGTTISQDNTNLFWDNTNKRLGLLGTAPAGTIDILGNANTTVFGNIDNLSTGTNARAAWRFRNSTVSSNTAFVGITGEAYTGVSGWADAFFIQTNSNVDGGIRISSLDGVFIGSVTLGTNNLVIAPTTGNLLSGVVTDDATNRIQADGGIKGTDILSTSIDNGVIGDSLVVHDDADNKFKVIAPLSTTLADYSTTATTLTSSQGTYTPTLTNTTNVASSTAFVTNWYRIGNSVHVYGKVTITPTAGSSAYTELQMSLPVASNFTDTKDLAGIANNGAGEVTRAFGVNASSANDRAVFGAFVLTTTAITYPFSFSYIVQ